MSHHPHAPPLTFRPLSLDEVRAAAAAARTDWLWHGYLVPGGVTLLTSLWKAGKTTLLSVLLHRMKVGGELAGAAVTAAQAVVVSEEDPALWERRSRRLDFGEHVSWLCRPFRARPTPAEWRALIDSLAALRRERGTDLAVIDPLASFLPGRDENTAGLMLEALLPLQALTAEGMAVLLLHHPRKQSAAPGQTARGSGALSAHVDVILEMTTVSADPDDRRRRLLGFSRFTETPADRVIELNAEGTHYAALGDFAEQEFLRGWRLLRLVLTDARDKLTRREILDAWPADEARPSDTTLWRWLERAAARDLLRREGAGHCTEPFRYWLTEKEAVWREDPIWVLLQHQREAMKGLER
jgi:hypothetical protein